MYPFLSGPWELVIIMLIFAQFIYYVPTMISMAKKRPDIMKVFVINLLSGWTLFGWVITLVWVLATDSRKTKTDNQ